MAKSKKSANVKKKPTPRAPREPQAAAPEAPAAPGGAADGPGEAAAGSAKKGTGPKGKTAEKKSASPVLGPDALVPSPENASGAGGLIFVGVIFGLIALVVIYQLLVGN